MEDRLKDLLGAFSLITMLICVILLIGTAGAVENNELMLEDAAKRGIILFVVLVISIIGIAIDEKEEDIYDRL